MQHSLTPAFFGFGLHLVFQAWRARLAANPNLRELQITFHPQILSRQAVHRQTFQEEGSLNFKNEFSICPVSTEARALICFRVKITGILGFFASGVPHAKHGEGAPCSPWSRSALTLRAISILRSKSVKCDADTWKRIQIVRGGQCVGSTIDENADSDVDSAIDSEKPTLTWSRGHISKAYCAVGVTKSIYHTQKIPE